MFPRLLEHALFDKLGASKFAHTCLRSDCAASTMTFSFCVASSPANRHEAAVGGQPNLIGRQMLKRARNTALRLESTDGAGLFRRVPI